MIEALVTNYCGKEQEKRPTIDDHQVVVRRT